MVWRLISNEGCPCIIKPLVLTRCGSQAEKHSSVIPLVGKIWSDTRTFTSEFISAQLLLIDPFCHERPGIYQVGFSVWIINGLMGCPTAFDGWGLWWTKCFFDFSAIIRRHRHWCKNCMFCLQNIGTKVRQIKPRKLKNDDIMPNPRDSFKQRVQHFGKHVALFSAFTPRQANLA